jgi:uncharacterized protein YfaP (DUF2135 family)
MKGEPFRCLSIATISSLLTVLLIIGCSKKEESGPVGPAIADATVKGVVNNAINGERIADALVEADDGNSTRSLANGLYQLDLSSGARTLTVTKTDFDTSRRTVQISSGGLLENINFPISPKLTTAGEMRFVLSWGSAPQDLDAHLLTPSISGTVYHIFWNNAGSADAPPYASLDVDETEGYGPETITIHDLQAGTYHYWVHRFSDDAELAGSEAVVEVYGSGGLLSSYTAPSTGTDEYWHVFDINGSNGSVQSVNQLVAEPPGVDRTSYQIWLTWAEEPGDLDANLLTPTISGNQYHVWSGNLGHSDQPPYVTLNQDVQTGYGPEVITIHQFFPGTYTYYVANYGAVPLTQSEAFVDIYDGTGIFLLGWITVPTSGSGRYWSAFTIDGTSGEMTGVNELSDIPPGAVLTELLYDDSTPTDYIHFLPEYVGSTMASRLSPSGPGRLMSLKFMTNYSGMRGFTAEVYGMTGDQPQSPPAYTEDFNAAQEDWVTVDVSDQYITFTGDFLIGVRFNNNDTWLGYDDVDNYRSWVLVGGSWQQWDKTLFIRAVVLYANGVVAEIGPETPKLPSSAVGQPIPKLRNGLLSRAEIGRR